MTGRGPAAGPDGAASRGGHPVFAAVYARCGRRSAVGPVGDARRKLLADAHGEVADLGAGVGLNLPYLGAQVRRIHLVEPDPHMLRRLAGVLPQYGQLNPRLHPQPAERLPFDDACLDTVISTLTLCTVDDPAAVANEIQRVLRPGGRLLVIEHVRSLDPRKARSQDRWARPWGWFTGGCHPNRDTGATLAAAGFDLSGVTRQLLPGEWLTGEILVGAVPRGPGPTAG